MRYSKLIRPARILSDIIAMNFAIIFAPALFFGFGFSFQDETQLLQMLFLDLSWLLAAFIMGIYVIPRGTRYVKLISLLIRTDLIYALLFFTIIYFLQYNYPPFYIVIILLSTAFANLISQLIILSLKRKIRNLGKNTRSVIIVGYGDLSSYLLTKIQSNKSYGYRYLGCFGDVTSVGTCMGSIDEVIPFLEKVKVDEIYCFPVYVDPSKMGKVISYATDKLIAVKVIPDYRGYQYNDMAIEMVEDIPVLSLLPLPLEDAVNVFLKRLFDLTISLFLYVTVLWWLIPLIAIIIKIDSRGPVFFKQARIGKGNKPFMIYKFRSMYVHDDKAVKQATRNDSRITRVGKILRQTSLDEVPQLINVILGNMSLIGPRPHALTHNNEFREIIRNFNERHAVKPGITGLAQAKGYRGEISCHQDLSGRIKLDIFYVRNWSLLMDIKIILLTIWSLIKGQDSAY